MGLQSKINSIETLMNQNQSEMLNAIVSIEIRKNKVFNTKLIADNVMTAEDMVKCTLLQNPNLIKKLLYMTGEKSAIA